MLVPALLACRRVFFGGPSPEKGDLMLLGSLLQPALLLIDHGHFQYNSISLGFAVSSTPVSPGQSLCMRWAVRLALCPRSTMGDCSWDRHSPFLGRLELLQLLLVAGTCWGASSSAWP